MGSRLGRLLLVGVCPTPYGGPGCPAPPWGAGAMFAPDPLWGAGLPRPHVGGWGGGLLISIERARPTHVYKPAEALAIGGGGRGAAGQGANRRFQVMFRKFSGPGDGCRRVPTARAGVAPSGAAFDAAVLVFSRWWSTRAWRCMGKRRLPPSRRCGAHDGIPRGCSDARAVCAGALARACPMSLSGPKCWQHRVVRPVKRP
jgi:hypothetical protein